MIGLSGGPDSVCLFSVLNELKGEMGFRIHAVHVNHGLRPGAADEDQKYVEELCEKYGVPCSTFAYDCNEIAEKENLSTEEAGRKVRYGSFRKVAEGLIAEGADKNSVKIAVAQNADDQAETVLLRLLRGTGTDGLAGMAYSRKEQNICVIRPLLDTWRKDIEVYCRENNLAPRTDKTNLEPIYTRNKVRLQLIPYLKENFNENIMETLNRLSQIAGEDKEYLWQCAEEAYKGLLVSPGILDQKGLAELAAPVRHRVIMKALQEQGLSQDVTYTHLEMADRILSAAGESRTVEFPDGYRMSVRYGQAAFFNAERDLASAQLKVKVTENGGKYPQGTAAFDYDKIKAVYGEAEICLRTRKEGDYIAIANGRKKIQDLFIDMKVPKENRDAVLVAAIGREVLWLPHQPELGVKKTRYSNLYKLDIDTKNTLLLELVCEI